jgi:heme exporter protein A
MEGARLSVDNLACRRGERVLFRGLSFDLGPGEALQVRGANGTGKSSLMRILAGLLGPFAGTVDRRGAIGLLDDRLPLDEHLPLGKAFAFWNRIDQTHSPGALASVGIDGLLDVPVRFLSTGQRKRAALLLTVFGHNEILLLDEPLNGLDAAGAQLLYDQLAAYRAQGALAVIASHQPLGVPDLRTLDLADYAP